MDNGLDIISIGVNNPGIRDHEVMSIAISEHRTIITFDRDYGELIFKHNYKSEAGVIYLRLDEFTPESPSEVIFSLIELKIIFNNALTVVDKNGIRQRKYYLFESIDLTGF